MQYQNDDARHEQYSDSFQYEQPSPGENLSQEEIYRRIYNVPWLEKWVNFIVFGVVALFVIPFFIWGGGLLRFSSDNHFLLNKPISSMDSLEPILGAASAPNIDSMMDDSILIILWSPWDTKSCQMISSVAPLITQARANPHFRVIPIAYPLRMMSYADETQISDVVKSPEEWELEARLKNRELERVRGQKDPLANSLKASFAQNRYKFDQVWWDPTDEFRTSQIRLLNQMEPSSRRRAHDLGVPTVLLVEGGLVSAAWDGASPENTKSLKERLQVIAAMR